ncbi:unnamed protein product [Fraxinus pennsylvanica]|uniref:ABC transmembrane type-1 domain-containing protein n=1 Tax=Fraxinus pennsylvanica TaxID=56036 RepID=A0AAD1YZH4_9LAMI|nr:unnamed protein product [Fraxinus pennsylvanica]
MGCLPVVITLTPSNAFHSRGCIESLSSIAVDYNQQLHTKLKVMESYAYGTKIVYADIYKPLDEITKNPSRFDGFDVILMIMGFLGAAGDGISIPLMTYITAKLMNNIGAENASIFKYFTEVVNQNALGFCYLACGQSFACFLGYCWTRTAERQASHLRTSYLKAVLRQDVGYFDLHVSSTADVIASVSSDSLVIQDVISEKVEDEDIFAICAGIQKSDYRG